MQALKVSSWDDKVFYTFIYVLITIISLAVLYPLVLVVSTSFSSPEAVASGKVFLFPVNFSLEGYNAVFKNKQIVTGFLNTLSYTVVGTTINLAVTLIAAYPLAQNNLPARKPLMFLFTFPMLFSGGMIPNYILLMNLNMLNTRWAMLIPGALSIYNMIICRTFIQGLPHELTEAAKIDGCSQAGIFIRIILPLSKAIIAVLTLYYSVGHWNAYFNAFLYLSDRKLYPLQIILREVLVANVISAADIIDSETALTKSGLAELLKYALIIVSSTPVIILYPFIQKFFVKGVMIGSLKG